MDLEVRTQEQAGRSNQVGYAPTNKNPWYTRCQGFFIEVRWSEPTVRTAHVRGERTPSSGAELVWTPLELVS